MNVLDMRGPDFLNFYIVTLALATFWALLMRELLRRPAGPDPAPEQRLTGEEAAYLAGGLSRVIQLGMAELVQRGNATVEESTRSLRRGRPLTREATPVMRRLYDCFGSERSLPLRELETSAGAAWPNRYDRLVERGLVISRPTWTLLWVVALSPGALLLSYGIVKIFVGISRDRPIGTLFQLCGLTVALIWAFLGNPPRRSRRGDQALETLRAGTPALRETVRADSPRLGYADLALAVALYGVNEIKSGPLGALGAALRAASSSSGAEASGFSSGSTCGGGGGGGGGGGSSCGGCGS